MNCELCGSDIQAEKCAFANYKREIDGKEYVFCCSHCADVFEEKK